jgi:hypothetical protein
MHFLIYYTFGKFLYRHSFQQARKYFGHLATIRQDDADVWLCLSVCCAMAEEFSECATAIKTAQDLIGIDSDDVRIKFCKGMVCINHLQTKSYHLLTFSFVGFFDAALMAEKRKDYTIAMEGYVTCLNYCAASALHATQQPPVSSSDKTGSNDGNNQTSDAGPSQTSPSNEENNNRARSEVSPTSAAAADTCAGSADAATTAATSSAAAVISPAHQKLVFMKELRGEVMLRIAVLKKEMGAIDQAMHMCNTITEESFGDSIRANALCLKVCAHSVFYCFVYFSFSPYVPAILTLVISPIQGLLHEMRSEFPASEVVYRTVLQISTGHATALERLGRVYLRYVHIE